MAVALSLLCEKNSPNLCLVSELGKGQDTPKPGFDPRSTINVYPYSSCIPIVRRGYTLKIWSTFDLRKTFYRSSSLQTCRPPKTPNPMHSGPGCGFIALALTRAFGRYVGRGGGGGTKKKLGCSLQTYGIYLLLVRFLGGAIASNWRFPRTPGKKIRVKLPVVAEKQFR